MPQLERESREPRHAYVSGVAGRGGPLLQVCCDEQGFIDGQRSAERCPRGAPTTHLLRRQGLVQHLHVGVLGEVVEFTQVGDDPFQMLQQLGGGGAPRWGPTLRPHPLRTGVRMSS